MRRLPLPADGYTWLQAAVERKLEPEVVDRLRRDKIAYGRTTEQSFSPYLGGPVFITSDSLLNGFHVLLEDTFRDHEKRQVQGLRNQLEILLRKGRENLAASTFPARATAPSWRHAQLVVGPALVLLGSSFDLFDPDTRGEIEDQVAKIRAAQSTELPAWLSPATDQLPAIDYRRCKPVGFYATDPMLADYFRAVRWLQLVPFRMDRDVEVGAIAMLGYAVSQSFGNNTELYFRAYGRLLGSRERFGLPEAAHVFQNLFDSGSSMTWEALLGERKRDVLWQAFGNGEDGDVQSLEESTGEADARLAKISYRVLPAYQLPDSVLFEHLMRRNLEPEGLGVAAMLGSAFARQHFDHFTVEEFDAAVSGIDFMPIEQVGADEASVYEEYLRVLSTLFAAPPLDAPAFMRGPAWQAKSTQTALSGWVQMRHTFTLQAHESEHYIGVKMVPPGFVEPNPEFYSRLGDLIERTHAMLGGEEERWGILVSLTRKLEALSYKQLRAEPWTPADGHFFETYGGRLGRVMGYEGDAYFSPQDDAPRWATVHRNADDRNLAVAVGRPRYFYVLYPWNGMEILCTGSVMPYYEYESKNRLTDDEWKALLDSPRAPAQPRWLETARELSNASH